MINTEFINSMHGIKDSLRIKTFQNLSLTEILFILNQLQRETLRSQRYRVSAVSMWASKAGLPANNSGCNNK